MISRKWIFGKDLQWLCQLAHSCQGTPVFLSSMAIVAIGKQIQYGEAKMIPLIFLEYFVKYLSMKGLMMFKLHMGRVREGVFGHSHPFATPSSPKKTQNHNFY